MHDGADSPRDLFPALPNPQVAKPAIPPAQFTRQSNWERLVLDGIPDFLHVFSSDGIITYASNSCNAVTKYQPCELVGRPIADFIHPDDYGVFAHETDESISRLTSARFHYRFRSAGGSWTVLEARCRPFIIDPLDALPPPYAGMGCVDVVVMARPYPTGNISLLDSFLEFKMENVRLQTKIEQLKREACEDETTFHLQQQQPKENKIPAGPLLSPFSIPNRTKPKHESELPTDVPAPTFTAHIHVTLSQDTSALQSKPHIKMENPNGQGVPFTLVADPQASVVLGDLGIPISKSRITAAKVSPSSKLKRKALESAESAEPNLCTFCGTVSSPEWRKGPEGPKTLCNACGIRWKRRSSIKDKV